MGPPTQRFSAFGADASSGAAVNPPIPSPTLTNDMVLPGLPSPPNQSTSYSYLQDPVASTYTNAYKTMSLSRPLTAIAEPSDKTLKVFASSPTLRNSAWEPTRTITRRESDALSSVNSDDLEDFSWPRFESTNGIDTSSDIEEEEEQFGSFPGTAESDNTEARWDSPHADMNEDDDDDPFSSAALSRRADMILANAKKRLSLMEGNLRGARSSLMSSSSSHSLLRSPTYLRDRGSYSALGYSTDPYHQSPNTTSPGHARISSENDLQTPPQSTRPTRPRSQFRSSSALAFSLGKEPLERASTVRESRSQESLGVKRWPSIDDRQLNRSPPGSGSKASSGDLDSVPENRSVTSEDRRSPTTATNDLREQMEDLKGRISRLKERAKEDGMRRASLQNLRTPNPFTHAPEDFYTSADGYQESSPLSANAGMGWSPNQEEYSSPKLAAFEKDPVPHTRTRAASKASGYTESHYEDAEDSFIEGQDAVPESSQDSHYQDKYDEDDNIDDFATADGESIYQESVYEDAPVEPLPERHEDRADAFDYQNFFLHSAMGTIRRRDSVSSNDSVETTRPASPYRKPPSAPAPTPNIHKRNESTATVSTMASFVTAGEGSVDGSDSGDEETLEQMEQALGSTWVNDDFMKSSPTLGSAAPTPTAATFAAASRSDSLMNGPPKPQPATTNGILPLASRDMLAALGSLQLHDTDKALIGTLERSLKSVCEQLATAGRSPYESREWRRRLDLARRVLDGEDM